MTDLTEQWKKGELPNGIYYVELLSGNTTIAYMYKMRSCKKIVYRVKSFKGYISKNQMKAVLSEVPSYEEWQAKENNEDFLQQRISVLESKNQQLKELLKEVRDALVIYKPYDRNQLCKKIDNAIGEKKCREYLI